MTTEELKLEPIHDEPDLDAMERIMNEIHELEQMAMFRPQALADYGEDMRRDWLERGRD